MNLVFLFLPSKIANSNNDIFTSGINEGAWGNYDDIFTGSINEGSIGSFDSFG